MLKLYHNDMSTCSQKSRLCLAEKGCSGRTAISTCAPASIRWEPIKRERRRDVIEKGLDSPHFKVAVARMELLLTEMEQALSQHDWLATGAYSLADAAYTPYLVRLDHLNILGMIEARPQVAGWYRRLKQRPSFSEAIVRWENEKYLTLMKSAGAEAWPRVQAIKQEL